MAVSIRLKRFGKRGAPHYRVVVIDERRRRDGRQIDTIGIYQPKSDPATVRIDEEKVLEWLQKGARPSATVRSLLSKQGIMAKFAAE